MTPSGCHSFYLHISILLGFIAQMLYRNSCESEHLKRIFFVMIMHFAYNPLDSTVYNKHRTSAAWCHFAIDCCTVNCNTSFCCLAYSVLLCVYSAYTVLGDSSVRMDYFTHQMSRIITMRKTCRRTDIPGHKNLVVACNYAARSASVAGCAFRDRTADFHKVFIPCRTYIFFTVFIFVCHKTLLCHFGINDNLCKKNCEQYPRNQRNILELTCRNFADNITDNAP
jgi:hypothetical protein